jgi:hypothetical protein
LQGFFLVNVRIIFVTVPAHFESAAICASCVGVAFFANSVRVFPTVAELIPLDRLANLGVRVVVVVVSVFVFHVTEDDRNLRAVNFYFRFFNLFSRTILVPSAFSFTVGTQLFFVIVVDTPTGPGPAASPRQAIIYSFSIFFS